jgi:hypothetical protein
MIKLQTKIDIADILKPIRYEHKIMALGSCFAANIGTRLSTLKYNIELNPFGIQYNPSSIANGLLRLIDASPYGLTDLFEHQGLWHSFDHHGSFSGREQASVLLAMNQRLEATHQHLLETDVLILTLGTAWVFELASSGLVVNNCHKLPADLFKRQRLSVEAAVAALKGALEALWALRPEMQVLLTVSPIRHLKDGAIENQLSKSTLLLAVDTLQQAFSQLSYFPAYELMMDELRDYRFYARDLTHPNDLAVDYIWARFEAACLDKGEATLRNKIEKIMLAIHHRPIHPESPSHKSFLEKLYSEIRVLDKSSSSLNFEVEMRYLLGQLNK